jgi:hypothetical protein
MQFVPYPKTPRLRRSVVFTEKIDGTNAQIVITPLDDRTAGNPNVVATSADGQLVMLVGSRSRWITPGKTTDNYGFATWCQTNASELFKLGEGQHFGEWYGQGIQCGYGLAERRFALFNTARWGKHNPNTPACCEAVPVIATADFSYVDEALAVLREHGSVAVPGWMKPEGVIAYHTASGQVFKALLENDDTPKGLVTS